MYSTTKFLVFLVLSINQAFAASGSFGYIKGVNGPDTWATTFAASCAANANSPIDIPYDGTTRVKDWLPFQLMHYEVYPERMYIENNGHSAEVTFEPDDCHHIPTVIQGNLPGTFQLAQLHFHWGSSSTKGSEHTLHGRQYDAELHFVHYNTECGWDLTSAITNCPNTKGAAVLGVLIQADDGDNHDYDEIINGLRKIKTHGSKVEIKPFDISKLLPHDLNEFYRYEGGLTTPSCSEVVTWTIFREFVKISKRQLERFFELQTTNTADGSATALIDNFRPPQPLNDRTVYYADLKLRCKHHGWTSAPFCTSYYREMSDERDFMGAIHSCMGYNYAETPFEGLITVGRLRCLRNRFKTGSTYDLCGRFFRVNGIKDNRGVWREYPTGKKIQFHHYPEFDTKHGGAGDTLVWDAFLNRLFIQNEYDNYEPLCYRDYQNDCEECPGFENDNVCSEAGECKDNQCICDDSFSGSTCHIGEGIPQKEVVLVGGSKTTMFYSGVANQAQPSSTNCEIDNYMTETSTVTGQMCDFVFGRGICCGGQTSTLEAKDSCMYYDCHTNDWEKLVNDFPQKLSKHAANIIRRKGRDMYWLIAGGEVDSKRSKEMYWLNDDLVWQRIGMDMENERVQHCQVQINDCEVAFIGGQRGADLKETEKIDIFNYETMTWRAGPDLKNAVDFPACGVITDRTKCNKKVVIGCGKDSNGANLQVWDLESNRIYEDSNYACPNSDSDITTSDDGHFKELDDNRLVFTNSRGMAYIFDMENGFSSGFSTGNTDDYNGNSFVAPRGTVECN